MEAAWTISIWLPGGMASCGIMDVFHRRAFAYMFRHNQYPQKVLIGLGMALLRLFARIFRAKSTTITFSKVGRQKFGSGLANGGEVAGLGKRWRGARRGTTVCISPMFTRLATNNGLLTHLFGGRVCRPISFPHFPFPSSLLHQHTQAGRYPNAPSPPIPKSIKIHQNPSKSIKIHRNPSPERPDVPSGSSADGSVPA